MWGSDYPHDEGTFPYTTLALRQVFHDWPEGQLRKVLADNAADIYGFDLEALAGPASRLGPAVSEVAQPLTELPDQPNEALLANCLSPGGDPPVDPPAKGGDPLSPPSRGNPHKPRAPGHPV
jgi:hypothetical protein